VSRELRAAAEATKCWNCGSLASSIELVVGAMTWWDVLASIGVAGVAIGIGAGELVLLRLLPWGKNWHVSGYF